jgi:hypothetical protein
MSPHPNQGGFPILEALSSQLALGVTVRMELGLRLNGDGIVKHCIQLLQVTKSDRTSYWKVSMMG